MKNTNKNTKTNTASTFLDRATKSSATKPSVKTTKAAVPAGRRIVAAKPVTKSTKPTVKPTTKPAVKTTPKRSRHTPTQNKQ